MSIDRFVDDVAELVDRVVGGGPADLWGFILGALTATGVAVRHPGTLELLERLREVSAEFDSRAACSGAGGPARVIPFGMKPPDLMCWWATEQHDVRLGLVDDASDDVSTRVARQQTRRTEVVVCERRQGRDKVSMACPAGIDEIVRPHRRTPSGWLGLAGARMAERRSLSDADTYLPLRQSRRRSRCPAWRAVSSIM